MNFKFCIGVFGENCSHDEKTKCFSDNSATKIQLFLLIPNQSSILSTYIFGVTFGKYIFLKAIYFNSNCTIFYPNER